MACTHRQTRGKDAGRVHVRERVFLPVLRSSVERRELARGRDKDAHVLSNTEDDTERQENG